MSRLNPEADLVAGPSRGERGSARGCPGMVPEGRAYGGTIISPCHAPWHLDDHRGGVVQHGERVHCSSSSERAFCSPRDCIPGHPSSGPRNQPGPGALVGEQLDGVPGWSLPAAAVLDPQPLRCESRMDRETGDVSPGQPRSCEAVRGDMGLGQECPYDRRGKLYWPERAQRGSDIEKEGPCDRKAMMHRACVRAPDGPAATPCTGTAHLLTEMSCPRYGRDDHLQPRGWTLGAAEILRQLPGSMSLPVSTNATGTWLGHSGVLATQTQSTVKGAASPGSGASCVLDPGPTSVSQPNRGAEQTVGVGSHPTGQRRGNEIPPTHTTHTSFSSSYYMGSSTLSSSAFGRIGAGVGEEEPAGTHTVLCSGVPTVNLVDSSEGTLVTASPRSTIQGYETEPQRSALSKGQHARQRAGKRNREGVSERTSPGTESGSATGTPPSQLEWWSPSPRDRRHRPTRVSERVRCPRDRGHSSPSSSNDRGSTPLLAPGLCATMPNSMPTHPEVGWLVAMLPSVHAVATATRSIATQADELLSSIRAIVAGYYGDCITPNTPAAHCSTPAVHQYMPAVTSRTPAAHCSTPAVHQYLPAVTYHTPAVIYNTPAAHCSTPAVHQYMPAVTSHTPAA